MTAAPRRTLPAALARIPWHAPLARPVASALTAAVIVLELALIAAVAIQ